MGQVFNVDFWDDQMGGGAQFGTAPQQLTGDVP